MDAPEAFATRRNPRPTRERKGPVNAATDTVKPPDAVTPPTRSPARTGPWRWKSGRAREEVFDVVDETGRAIGRAPRSACHGNPALIHPSVHVHVFDRQGRLFLQKRSRHKETQPGRWDTSVGGHLRPGEDPAAGARREAREELGWRGRTLRFLYAYLWRCPRESEWVRTYAARADGPFTLDPVEIDDGRFWTPEEIDAALGTGVFTPNFEEEWRRLADGPAMPGRRH
jgi:isopentenyldiphosphate isomerase